MLCHPSPARRLLPGEGIIQLDRSGDHSSFSDLQFSFPIKVIAPSRHFGIDGLSCCYLLSYGGGLVAGDRVKVEVRVRGGSGLVMLTQGSTKVYKTRLNGHASSPVLSPPAVPEVTRQLMAFTVSASSSLFLLPAPVTCFARANYSQQQTFHLSASSNLVLLDWYTSGRMDMAGEGREEWEFERYRSSNEVFLDGERVARDVLLLEDDGTGTGGKTSYYNRVAPYSCYATLILVGPALAPLLDHLRTAFGSITQYKQSRPYSMLWSFSELEKGKGGVARCAGNSTEAIKDWVVQVLKDGGIEDLIGKDLWKNAFT